MSALSLAITRHPRVVLLLVGAVTLVAIAGIVDPLTGAPRLRIDPSFEKLLSDHDPGRRSQASQERRFGTGEWVVVALEPQAGALSLEGLDQIAGVEKALNELPEIANTTSIASAPDFQRRDGELVAMPTHEAVHEHPERLPDIRAAALTDPLRAGTLVSRDGRLAAIQVGLEPMSETDLVASGLDRRVASAVHEAAPGSPVWIAGAPFFKAEMSRILNRELATQVPLVLLLMVVAAFVVFRSLTQAWLPVATITVALVWTLGAMGWAGHALNLVTSIVPPLVLVVGFAYAIHVVAEVRAVVRAGDRHPSHAARVASALATVRGPVILTALTTAGAFLSLETSAHAAIREFGRFGALGVAAALGVSLTFTPAVLALAAAPTVARFENRERRLDRVFDGIARFDLRHRKAILFASVLVFLGSLAAATRIEVDTRTVENFHADSMIRRSYERLNEALDGADVFTIAIDGPGRRSLLEPARLREIASLQDWLASQPEVGGTTSIVDHLQAGSRLLGAAGPLDAGASRALVAQLLWLSDGDTVDPILDGRRQSTLVQVRSRATSSREIGELVARIEGRLAGLGHGLTAVVTGGTVLLTRAVDDVSRDQAVSLVAAFAIIYAILALAFRSARLAGVALLPNALPVAVYFGVLGLTGIPLNNATALLGCVVLGIAIDDTLHFVVRHRSHTLQREAPDRAARAALTEVGRPVTWTTLALCLGLLVLTTSELVTQAQFGALGAFTLLFAWAVDLTVTPALCSLLDWNDGERVSGAAGRESARGAPQRAAA